MFDDMYFNFLAMYCNQYVTVQMIKHSYYGIYKTAI